MTEREYRDARMCLIGDGAYPITLIASYLSVALGRSVSVDETRWALHRAWAGDPDPPARICVDAQQSTTPLWLKRKRVYA